jgi:hypothetical protein
MGYQKNYVFAIHFIFNISFFKMTTMASSSSSTSSSRGLPCCGGSCRLCSSHGVAARTNHGAAMCAPRVDPLQYCTVLQRILVPCVPATAVAGRNSPALSPSTAARWSSPTAAIADPCLPWRPGKSSPEAHVSSHGRVVRTGSGSPQLQREYCSKQFKASILDHAAEIHPNAGQCSTFQKIMFIVL